MPPKPVESLTDDEVIIELAQIITHDKQDALVEMELQKQIDEANNSRADGRARKGQLKAELNRRERGRGQGQGQGQGGGPPA